MKTYEIVGSDLVQVMKRNPRTKDTMHEVIKALEARRDADAAYVRELEATLRDALATLREVSVYLNQK